MKLDYTEFDMLVYFWEQKGDLERYTMWDELQADLRTHNPEIIAAWTNYKVACTTLSAVLEHARHTASLQATGDRDVRTLTVDPGFVDLICGGFPCQPFSTAARGRNNAADLWPEFLRIVRGAQPDWVVAENVPGIGDEGIERVCSDLEGAGYFVWPFDVDAALPQRQRGRHRIIWLAHTDRKSQPRFSEHAQMASVRTLSSRCEANSAVPLGVDDELPGRMDRLHALGNAIPPTISEAIGMAILASSSD